MFSDFIKVTQLMNGRARVWNFGLFIPRCRERLKVRGEGDDRGWDGWMASLTRWTWVWVSSGSWWWTEKPGMLYSMRLQRVRHDWATELNWTDTPSPLLIWRLLVTKPVKRIEPELRVLCRHYWLSLACFLYLSIENSKPSTYWCICVVLGISSPYISSLELERKLCICNLSFVWALRNLGKATRQKFFLLLGAVWWVSQLFAKRISFLGT